MVQTLNPNADVTVDAGWTIGGGSGSHNAAQSDASDATYSTGNTEGAVLELGVPNANDPGDSALHRLVVRKHNRGVSFVSTWLDVSIVQGATVIGTWRIDLFGTPGIADYTNDLTALQAAAITDYDDLRIRMVDARTGATITHEVYKSWIELDDAPAPIADFVADVTSGVASLTVTFTNLSDTAAGDGLLSDWTYAWIFGDGGTSTLVHPTHTYTVPGTYSVRLTVTGPGGVDIETKVGYVTVSTPVPDFVGAPLSGAPALLVNFTDLSTGSNTGWAWDFGDSGSSALPNPSHTYLAAGVYTVSLSITGLWGGPETETKVGYVVVTDPPPPTPSAPEQPLIPLHASALAPRAKHAHARWP